MINDQTKYNEFLDKVQKELPPEKDVLFSYDQERAYESNNELNDP